MSKDKSVRADVRQRIVALSTCVTTYLQVSTYKNVYISKEREESNVGICSFRKRILEKREKNETRGFEKMS